MIDCKIKVERHSGVKCPRCYHYSYSMNFDSLCNRCVAILTKHYPESEQAKECFAHIEMRGLTPKDNPEWNNV
jgi:hypothetical protein